MARTLARSGIGPVYEQIRRAIADPIGAGCWRPSRRIPSETELTKAFKASRMTVNRALTALAADGLIFDAIAPGRCALARSRAYHSRRSRAVS